MALLLHFKDDGTKKYKIIHVFFFVLSFTRSNAFYYSTFISHLNKLQSVSFQMVTRILASGPELQAVRFGYVILGENGGVGSMQF